MIKFNALFFTGLFLSATLFSQNEVSFNPIEINGLEINYRMYEKKANSILGTTYLYDDWKVGDIELKNGEIIKGYPLRYDLKEHVIDLRLKDRDVIKVIKGEDLVKFQWTNELGLTEYFIACNTFKNLEEEKGFFELIGGDEEITILLKNRVEFVKSNYNEVLLSGVKEDKFSKKVDFFILKNDKLTPIKTKKKDIMKLAGMHSPDIKEYVFKNDLKYNKTEDLKMIFKQYLYLKGKDY